MGEETMAFEQKTLRRKNIQGFARGIAQKFACSAEHYAWLAWQTQCPQVRIDLLSLRIDPAAFDIGRNRILAAMCQETLLRNLAQLTVPIVLTSASLCARFGMDEPTAHHIGDALFTVELNDDQGKTWRAEYVQKLAEMESRP